MIKGFSNEPSSNEGKTNTWLTPPGIISDLGPFDLDPCAADYQPWKTAARHFTKKVDGLSRQWDGFVWMNPPYGRSTGTWMEKIARHGNGIALVFARTETRMFFESIWKKADALRFVKGRIGFYRPSGKEMGSAAAPSVLVAYGIKAVCRLRTSKIEGFFLDLRR